MDSPNGSLITAEYQGMAFSFQADGWFNATAAAKRYGKEAGEFLRLPSTLDYLSAIERKHGKIPQLRTKRGRPDLGGGTWLHPKLAVMFARWLDVDFALWCDEQIDDILRGPVAVTDAEEPSTVADRLGLLISAAVAVAKHRLRFDTVYRAFNAAAGSSHFRGMTKAQVRTAEPVAQRIAMGAATANDWRLIEESRPAQQQAQLSFLPGDEPEFQ